MTSNLNLVHDVIQCLFKYEVQEFVICAGARNSPFVVYFEESQRASLIEGTPFQSFNKEDTKIKIWNFFEERSASFFALGRARASKKPVAIITTSGTAAAELLPAAIEATYSGIPLILITADRPPHYRGSGAPQAIEQIGLFSHYAEKTLDIYGGCEGSFKSNLEKCLISLQDDSSVLNFKKPIHLNVCFEEPLLPPSKELALLFGSQSPWHPITSSQPITHSFLEDQGEPRNDSRKSIETKFQEQIKLIESFLQTRRPLVLLSSLHENDLPTVRQFLKQVGAPIYAEGVSHLRGDPQLELLQLKSGSAFLQRAFRDKLFDSVLRIGGIPTVRLWRDLELQYADLEVLSISRSPYSGLSRPSKLILKFDALSSYNPPDLRSKYESIYTQDQIRLEFINKLFKDFPKSEPALIHDFSKLPAQQSLYLGNSLPIREWDFAAQYQENPQRVFGNRGANGIDGQISTFLGWASPNTENWGLFGDLTTLYDLSAPWVANQLFDMDLRIVIINNQGGQIFDRMFHRKSFLNPHQLHFMSWAHLWGWSYQLWSEIPKRPHLKRRQIIEIQPSNEQTHNFWNAHDGFWKE